MRKIIKLLLFILCLAVMALNGCAKNADSEVQGSDTAVAIINPRQLVAADNKTGRTIMWEAKVKQPYTLEFRLQGSKDIQAVQATDSSFTDKNSIIQYTARLSGLVPGSAYEYRISTAQNKGRWHKLSTEKGDGFTALIFPDSQSADYSGWQQLAREAYKRHPESAFYVNMGDLVDNGQDASQWRAWFNSVSVFSDVVPLAPVIGNHEAYSLEWKECLPESYTHLFNVPQNGLAKYTNQFYSFDYGPVHFVVLDTNFPEMENFQPDLLADELQWLEKDLAASKAPWKVALMHRDIFLYGFGPESGRAQTKTHFLDFSYQLMPVFEKYKVDAVLTAHLHTYRRRVPLQNFAPAPRGSGITYILTGVAGSVRYPKLWGDFAWDAATAPKPETANYMTLTADGKTLEFKAFLPDGKQFDEVKLTK
ncbi:metallophosphoesterase family protein [Phascolarctobacterium succinatutens]|uniref:purple acid phosphatase family protein n=1 Tax=Phascolarctobacterium succinatutens TaxID=626940 RepID=UPI00307AC5FD